MEIDCSCCTQSFNRAWIAFARYDVHIAANKEFFRWHHHVVVFVHVYLYDITSACWINLSKKVMLYFYQSFENEKTFDKLR